MSKMKDNEEISPELEKYLKRYFKRTGIFRLYCIDRKNKKTQLLIEFAVRGKVLFVLRLWKHNHTIFDE